MVLRLNQLLHHGGQPGVPPPSTSSCLVFPEAALSELSLRISAVKEEKKTEKLRFKSASLILHLPHPSLCLCAVCVYRELHHQHVRLVRERRELEGKVKEWEEKVQQSMILKFGRVVDLDSLGAVTANHTADELRARLSNQEESRTRELCVLQVSV